MFTWRWMIYLRPGQTINVSKLNHGDFYELKARIQEREVTVYKGEVYEITPASEEGKVSSLAALSGVVKYVPAEIIARVELHLSNGPVAGSEFNGQHVLRFDSSRLALGNDLDQITNQMVTEFDKMAAVASDHLTRPD